MYEIINNTIYTTVTYDYRPGGRGDEIKTTTLKLCFEIKHLGWIRDIIESGMCRKAEYKRILNNIIPVIDPFTKGVIGRNFVYFTEIRSVYLLSRLLEIQNHLFP